MPTISTKVALAMMKRSLLFVAASFFLAPGAYAQDPCDFNGDGTVDKFEADSCFGPCDFNRDGTVDQFEADSCGGPPPEGGEPPPGGDPCDSNGDGTVDQFEADSCGDPPPGGEPTFEAWQISPEATDTNDNGVIDLDDYYLHFPAAWLSSPGAIDYTGDGFIDFDDFFVFVDQIGGAPPPWGDPCDFDGDGVVDPTEADGCSPPSPGHDLPRTEDWLAGPDAIDLKEDGEIDFLDY